MAQSFKIDSKLRALLDSLRERIRRYVVVDSLLAIAAVVLGAFWIGLALDYGPVLLGGTEMPRTARAILLFIVSATVIGTAVKLLFGRLARPLPDDSLALLVERHHPQLGGRLVTTVQLGQSNRQGDAHDETLLKRVHDEATEEIDGVDPSRVFSWEPIIRKAYVAVPLLLASIAFLVVSPQAFGRAAGRLTLLSNDPWPRRANLEMVGVELPQIGAAEDDSAPSQLVAFEDRVVRLPRGSSGTLRIRAAAIEAEVPVVCTVYYRLDDGTRGQSNMRRIGRVVDGYQSFVIDGPPLASLSDSLTFSIHGLDDRLDNYCIEAVPPPAITAMEVSVRYPEYLRNANLSSDDFDLNTEYQAGLRLREGSDVVLTATSSVPLGDSDVVIRNDSGDERRVQLTHNEDRYQGQISLADFNRSTAIRIVPRDQDGISAQAPYRYFLGVISDEPPEIDVRLKGIGSAVTPIAKIPLELKTSDDYAVSTLDVSVAIVPSEEKEVRSDEEIEANNSIATQPLDWDRDGNSEANIDLRDLAASGDLQELTPDDVINVFAEATDGYDLGKRHQTRSELFRLQVVTPDKLLALLERRELGLRARLEQTIDETRNLRDSLSLLRRRSFDVTNDAESDQDNEASNELDEDVTRARQVRLLRVQQSGLQANKTSEELSGIAASLDDLLLEMTNNRVDSADRRERIGTGVRDPLRSTVDGPLQQLRKQIKAIEASIDSPAEASQKTMMAVATAEDVLLRLTAVLEKMLDLESYNEILDQVRDLIEAQEGLIDETKKEQKKRVLDLFK